MSSCGACLRQTVAAPPHCPCQLGAPPLPLPSAQLACPCPRRRARRGGGAEQAAEADARADGAFRQHPALVRERGCGWNTPLLLHWCSFLWVASACCNHCCCCHQPSCPLPSPPAPRYGNTSSSTVWYSFGFIESVQGVRRGDIVWQVCAADGAAPAARCCTRVCSPAPAACSGKCCCLRLCCLASSRPSPAAPADWVWQRLQVQQRGVARAAARQGDAPGADRVAGEQPWRSSRRGGCCPLRLLAALLHWPAIKPSVSLPAVCSRGSILWGGRTRRCRRWPALRRKRRLSGSRSSSRSSR